MKLSNILHIEILKLNSRRNYFLISIFILINFLLIAALFTLSLTLSSDHLNDTKIGEIQGLQNFYNHFISTISFLPNIFIALIIMVNVGNEFNNGILRKNIIDGYSKHEYFLSKMCFIFYIAFIIFIIYHLTFLLFGKLLRAYSFTELFSVISIAGMIKLCIIFFSYSSIALLIVTLLKGMGSSIISLLSYIFIEKLLVFFDNSMINIGYSDYLPLNVLNKVTYLYQLSTLTIIQILIYLFIIILSSYVILLKKDI